MEVQSFNIDSIYLNQKRTINVFSPEGFENVELPVLYLLDGGINEKFNSMLQIVKDLMRQDLIEPILLVGIENINRNFDFTNITYAQKDKKWVPEYGNSPQFMSFIGLELIPFINKNYHTNQDNCMIGESLGGLFVLELLVKNPKYFTRYIAIDPSLWWNKHKLFDQLINEFDSNLLLVKKLFVAASKTVSIKKLTDELVNTLNISEDINLHYHTDLNQNHFTIFDSSIKKALKWTFNRNSV